MLIWLPLLTHGPFALPGAAAQSGWKLSTVLPSGSVANGVTDPVTSAAPPPGRPRVKESSVGSVLARAGGGKVGATTLNSTGSARFGVEVPASGLRTSIHSRAALM